MGHGQFREQGYTNRQSRRIITVTVVALIGITTFAIGFSSGRTATTAFFTMPPPPPTSVVPSAQPANVKVVLDHSGDGPGETPEFRVRGGYYISWAYGGDVGFLADLVKPGAETGVEFAATDRPGTDLYYGDAGRGATYRIKVLGPGPWRVLVADTPG